MLGRGDVKHSVANNLIASHVVKAEKLHFCEECIFRWYGRAYYLLKLILITTRKNIFETVAFYEFDKSYIQL